jgi:2-methylcitrate dehydratase PrpD
MASTTTQLSAVHDHLGEFTSNLRFDDLPEQVVEKVKCNLLHDISCAMAAHTVGPLVWPLVTGLAPPEAALFCSGERIPADQAAFANAVLMHARAQDDTHFAAKCHAGSSVIPAALATTQRLGRSGADAITAMVAGYEVATSIGELLAGEATARGFRSSSVFGPLGAAAATASLLGLDGTSAGHAIALATSFSGGLNQTWIDGSTEWRWELGVSSRNGMLAARLAEARAHGARQAFEGAAGFARAFAGAEDWHAPELELGQRWRILDVIYKPYPVCNITQSPVAVAARLATRHDLSLSDLASARLYLNPGDRLYPGTLNSGPFADVGGSLMSAPFCVAMGLRYRTATLAGLGELEDAELSAAIDKIEVLGDDALPVLAARLELERVDGRRMVDELVPDEHTYNWDWEGVSAGAEVLRAEMAGNGPGLDRLREALRKLESLPDVDQVLSATEG